VGRRKTLLGKTVVTTTTLLNIWMFLVKRRRLIPSLQRRDPALKSSRASTKAVRDPRPHRLAVFELPGAGFSSPCSFACPEYLLIAARNGSLAPLAATFPLKMSANGTKLP
jgi:hypothetical protein